MGLFGITNDKVAAIQDDGSKITYLELNKYSDELANNIGERTLLFSLCSNTIGSLIGYVACQNNNIVPLLLSDKLDDELLNNLITTYCPKYIWVPENSTHDFSAFNVIYKKFGYELLDTSLISPEIYKDLALLLTTSGSTGSPKLVKQTYKNLVSNTESIVEYLKLDKNERAITTLPMNYTYGLSIVNTHLYVGATLLLTEKTLMQKGFWDFFKYEKATSFGGVPYTYEMLEKLRFFHMELPSLKYMTQAGGKLSPELHKEFAEYSIKNNKKFIVMYGQTEATARMTYLPAEKALEKYGSIGIAIPGGKISLLDTNDNIIDDANIVGEMVYEGPNVTLGYAQTSEDLTKGDERNGVLVTGDMAKRDEDGYLYIVGRKKRFLKIFGNRVNLDETERMLCREYPNLQSVCSGQDDLMIVYIVEKSMQNIDFDAIRKFMSLKTGLNSSAFKFKYIDMIPLNDAGKILYSKLEEHVCK